MRALDVALYGRSIGTLFEAGERFGLAFNEAYIDDPQAPII
jgi:hypothetical protein